MERCVFHIDPLPTTIKLQSLIKYVTFLYIVHIKRLYSTVNFSKSETDPYPQLLNCKV